MKRYWELEQEGPITWFHMAVSPGYILMYPELIDSMVTDNPEFTRAELIQRLERDASNERRYPVGNCDNWDRIAGMCLGHTEKP